MFELPDAKRVRREDLFDADSTRHSSPEEEEQAAIQARLKAHLSNLISFDLDPAPQEDDSAEKEREDEPMPDGEPEEPEFEFRLFSTGPAQKVVLAPAGDGQGAAYDENSGGILEDRPLSYYIREELSAEQKAQFEAAAISASDVLKGAKQRAWGLELPWRVTKIVVSSGAPKAKGEQGDTGDRQLDQDGIGKKKKLGKKGRIVARTKQKAAAELAKQLMTKEEHLKEKKKRLNREKKLKRRQKEKEKKLAAGGGAGGRDGAEGAESMSEGED